jgi:hypothetical protein
VGRRIEAAADVWLPYLIDGEALARIEAGQGVPLDDYELLEGLLVAWFERPDVPVGVPEPEALFRRALDEVVKAFHRPSIEVAVLEIARALGARHGWGMARAALRTGRALCPESAQIACDDVVACWRIIESGAADPAGLAHEILEQAPAIDTRGLRPMATQFLAVVYVAALALAHPEGDGKALAAEARERVSDPYLRRKLDELVARESPLDPVAFDLFETRGARG